jgi:opacity protein-like surface antigen
VQFRFGGLVNRRFEVNASAGYSSGQVGLESNDGSYSTYTASAAARFALSRWVSFDSQYFYYRYGFDDTVSLPFGFAPNMNRHGVRVGLTGWLPLIR